MHNRYRLVIVIVKYKTLELAVKLQNYDRDLKYYLESFIHLSALISSQKNNAPNLYPYVYTYIHVQETTPKSILLQ